MRAAEHRDGRGNVLPFGTNSSALMRAHLGQEEMRQRAHAFFHAEHAKGLHSLVARKIGDLRYYDVPNMERAVAICAWGRSGSILAASYLDGHDDVVMIPTDRDQEIYQFFADHHLLCLRDKLISYSILTNFFHGKFPIDSAAYCAAVAAIFEVYGNCPPQLLETRRAFFQFLHVAYNLSLGRCPASPHPLIVYAQHSWNDELARRFVEDFPQARFLHTVRDPITTFDRTFEHWSKPKSAELSRLIQYFGTTLNISGTLINSGESSWVIGYMARTDQPHPGTESRTRAIRFEDLHNRTEETMRRLVDWLGLQYHVTVLDSTFNGTPYVVERMGIAWSGPRPAQTLRSFRNIGLIDQVLLLVLFYENFVAWNYSCPKIFRHALVRGLTFILVAFVPLRGEAIRAKTVISDQVLPSLARGNLWFAFKCLFRILRWRFSTMRLLVAEYWRRLLFGKTLLEIL